MHQIRGQSLPKTFLEIPYEKRETGSSSSKTHTETKSTTLSSSSSSTHDSAAKGKEKGKEKEKETGEDKAKGTKLKKQKSKKEEKGISSMVGASLMTTTMFLPPATAAAASPTATASPILISSASGRDRSSSLTSQQSVKSTIGATNKDEQQASTSGAPLMQQGSTTITTTSTTTSTKTATASALLPPSLPRNSLDNSSTHSLSSSITHGHSHIRLPSIFKRRKHSSATTASLESSSSSTHSTSQQQPSNPLALPSTSTSLKQQHPILMAPQQDISITWPYAVPGGQAFIAGTWAVPGHGPWEKIPMSLVPGTTDKYEVSLNVQEVEDISDYLDEDGYLHHELLEHHGATTTAAATAAAAPTTPSAPSTPGSTPPATLSKRQRIRRFFGRARSSSTTSNHATSNNTHPKEDLLHPDLPYHHQSKDGIILPLSREYRYQYKFVIDDEWKCDPNRPQVQDSEGHWNHELTVELIEQIHQRPTASMLLEAVTNRSRSSSLQSQLTAPPVPKEGEGEEGEAIKQDQVEIKQDHVEVLNPPLENEAEAETEKLEIHSPPPPPYTAAVDKVIVSKPKVRAPRPPKDTFEAVLIFDEKDDLSDGEGGRVPRREDDDESDYYDSEEEEVHSHTTLSGDLDEEDVQQLQQPSKEEEEEEVQQQQIVGGDDAAGVVTPQQDDDDHSKQQPQHADNDQDAAVLLSAAAAITAAVATTDSVEHQAKEETTPAEPEAVAAPELPLKDAHESQDEDTFKLQAAADPEEHNLDSQQVVSDDDLELEEKTMMSTRALTRETSRAGLEVVTDNAAAVAAAAAAATTAALYSQVPSPPLTPSKDHHEQHDHHHSDKTLETSQTVDSTAEQEVEQKSFVPLTPRSEAPSFKLTSTHEEDKTFDVLENNDDHSSIHLRSQSSSSLLSTSSSKDQSENVESKNDTKKAGPEQFPNLLWSICKTTAVVSAAVVVLGFGLGRRRN